LGEHTIQARPHGEVIFDVLVKVVPESAPEALRQLSIRELVEGISEEELAAQAAEEAAATEAAQAMTDPATDSDSEVVELIELVEARSTPEDEEAAPSEEEEVKE